MNNLLIFALIQLFIFQTFGQVVDGDLEITNPDDYGNPFWQQSSLTYGHVLADYPAFSPGFTIYSGEFYAYFGGNTNMETSYLESSILFLSARPILTFHLATYFEVVPDASFNDSFVVTMHLVRFKFQTIF